jgi:16S rRNA pseudouridine516 synthase
MSITRQTEAEKQKTPGKAARRLDQLLSNLGYCSRREARTWIDSGRVLVKDRAADNPGMKCDPADVRIDGEPLDHPAGLLLLLHKPAGVVCSHDAREGRLVYDLIPERWRRRNPPVTSVGRLDQETTGLLLLTDQAMLVHRLTSPKHKVPKIYSAVLDRDVPADRAEEIARQFAGGALVLDGEKDPCRPAILRWLGPRRAELTLVEGRYHQVRRMFASEGFTVISLHRESFGNLTLGDLPPGKWQELPLDYPFA